MDESGFPKEWSLSGEALSFVIPSRAAERNLLSVDTSALVRPGLFSAFGDWDHPVSNDFSPPKAQGHGQASLSTFRYIKKGPQSAYMLQAP